LRSTSAFGLPRARFPKRWFSFGGAGAVVLPGIGITAGGLVGKPLPPKVGSMQTFVKGFKDAREEMKRINWADMNAAGHPFQSSLAKLCSGFS
jgi:hypothetical protein